MEICLFWLLQNTRNIRYVSKCLFIGLGSEVTALRRRHKETRDALFLRSRGKGSMKCESKKQIKKQSGLGIDEAVSSI